MALALYLHVQASMPSDHLCTAFLLPEPPQFLYQAPPGAQQLALPDFTKVPHFRHVTVLTIIEVGVEVLTDVVIGVRKISSRSGIGRRFTYSRVDGSGAASVSESVPVSPSVSVSVPESVSVSVCA